MNQRTELLTNNYKAVVAVMVYQSKSSDHSRGEYYLESHDVNDQGQIMQGKPLLQETLQEIVDVFFDERKNTATITGMLPDNLLNFVFLPGGNYRMVWYRPAEIRTIHFAAQLKIPTAKAWVPPMLYVVDKKSLDVYAMKSNSRPKESTRMCIAPFFNVNDDADVCLGNANVKTPREKTYSNLMKYWEDLFWLSEFTHVNGDDDKTVTKLIPLWQKIVKSKTKLKWSDLNELKYYPKTTLKNLIK